jgi:nucleotide-binding universal stress UspA family protein
MKMSNRQLRDAPQELSTLLATLEAKARAQVEALFETALNNASQLKRVVDFWDQPDLSVSFWALLVSGINDEVELRIADTILRWKGFYVRETASLICVQSSERSMFKCCANTFDLNRFPALVLGDSPEMIQYITFHGQLLTSLAALPGALHRFLTHVHSYLDNGKSLAYVAGQLGTPRFWSDLGLQISTTADAFTFVAETHNDRGFDLFLSHNSNDKKTIRRLATTLKSRGTKVWFDEWHLVPGRPWQEALEEIILNVKAAAVLVGKHGLGPWEIPEMRCCISEFIRRGLPVIPVLLPGADEIPELPMFLRQFTWIDLRKGLRKHALERLEAGISGVTPDK